MLLFTPIVESEIQARQKQSKGNDRYPYTKQTREATDFSRDHSGYLKDMDLEPKAFDMFVPTTGATSISISKRGLPPQKPKNPSTRGTSQAGPRQIQVPKLQLRPPSGHRRKVVSQDQADTIFSNNDLIDALNRAKKAKEESYLNRDIADRDSNRPRYKKFESFFQTVKNKKDKFNYLESESVFRGSLRNTFWQENLKSKKDHDITANLSYNLDLNVSINGNSDPHNVSSIVTGTNPISLIKINPTVDDSLRPNSRQVDGTNFGHGTRPMSRQTNGETSILVKETEVVTQESAAYPLKGIGTPPKRPKSGYSQVSRQSRQFRLSRPTSFMDLHMPKSIIPRSQNRPDYKTLFMDKFEDTGNDDVLKSIDVPKNERAKTFTIWGEEELFQPEAHAERAHELTKECETILKDLHHECDKYMDKIKLRLRNGREQITGPYLTFSYNHEQA